jgi:hypothetical protein
VLEVQRVLRVLVPGVLRVLGVSGAPTVFAQAQDPHAAMQHAMPATHRMVDMTMTRPHGR